MDGWMELLLLLVCLRDLTGTMLVRGAKREGRGGGLVYLFLDLY